MKWTSIVFGIAAGCVANGESDGTGGGDLATDVDTSGGDNSDADTDADSDSDTDTDTDTDADGVTGDTGEQPCGPDEITPLWMSPDDSNSMSSAVMARSRALTDGSVSGVPIRPWEFLNYYSFDYEPAGPDLLAFDVQMAHDADLPEGEYRLQIGISSESRTLRRPMNLGLSIDTSGSMAGVPIQLASDTCMAISASLAPGDLISVVTWDTTLNRLLSGYAVSGPSDPMVDGICSGLAAGSGTDLHSGLVAAYDLVDDNADAEHVSRVVLISDGGANVGLTDEELIGGEAGSFDDDGVYLVGVGVGTASSYNDTLMDTVTDLGRGAAVFVDSEEEAWTMFHDRFGEVMDIAAREVEVRLDLPPTFEILATSAEEVSTDRTEIEPQHIAPNDTMVFFQHIASCDPVTITDETPLTVLVTWKDDLTFLPVEIEQSFTFGELLAAPVRQLRRGAAIFAYAEALRLGTEEAQAAALARLAEADVEYPGDPELAEIRSVLTAL